MSDHARIQALESALAAMREEREKATDVVWPQDVADLIAMAREWGGGEDEDGNLVFSGDVLIHKLGNALAHLAEERDQWKRATDAANAIIATERASSAHLTEEREGLRAEIQAEKLRSAMELHDLKSALTAAHERAKSALKEVVETFGPWHEWECPGDDTCDCSAKPLHDAINLALTSPEGPQPRDLASVLREQIAILREIRAPSELIAIAERVLENQSETAGAVVKGPTA